MSLIALFLSFGFTVTAAAREAIELSDTQIDDLVRRSYQYVAMYNVNNKTAMDPGNPLSTGGWNRVRAQPVDRSLILSLEDLEHGPQHVVGWQMWSFPGGP